MRRLHHEALGKVNAVQWRRGGEDGICPWEVERSHRMGDVIAHSGLVRESHDERPVISEHLVPHLLPEGLRAPGAPQPHEPHDAAALAPGDSTLPRGREDPEMSSVSLL